MTSVRDETFNASSYASEAGKNQFASERNESVNIMEEPVMTVNSLSSDSNKEIEAKKPLEINHYQPETHSEFDHQRSSAADFENIVPANSLNSVGHLLRNARLAKRLSVEDVARQLRLSVPQIDAIEREDFEKLPGRTFLRGFIRNYANLVQLDPAPLLKLLPESARIISTHENTPFKSKQISFSSQRKNSKNNSLAIIGIVFIMIAGIYFLFGNNYLNQGASSKEVVSDIKIDAKTASVEIPLSLPTINKNTTASPLEQNTESDSNSTKQVNPPDTIIESDKSPSINISETKPATHIPVAEKTVVLSSDKDHLLFTFGADSWVKVVDGSGRLLLEQLKKAGSEQIVSGKKPFSIVIGNASGVNLTYNDKPIDMSIYKKQDGTARFKLE